MANFILERCSSNDQYVVGFDVSLNPQTGDTFSFSDSLTGETICGIIITGTNESTTYSAITEYNDCFECIQETPRSANTEYNICEVCFDGTVVTVYNLEPPHPIYTDGYGTPVTQLNMVTLGGPNGLNS
jgi:hypothetical protein